MLMMKTTESKKIIQNSYKKWKKIFVSKARYRQSSFTYYGKREKI